jgi:hypothetical protein
MSATQLLVLPRPSKRLLMLLGCIWSSGGIWDYATSKWKCLVFIVRSINGSRFYCRHRLSMLCISANQVNTTNRSCRNSEVIA